MPTRRESAIVALAALTLAGATMGALACNRTYTFGLTLAAAIGLAGGVFLICVDSLTQSITPNYIRGRVFGLRSMLNTLATVLINWTIWRLPEQTADSIMIPTLAVVAVLLILAGGWGLLRLLTTGPLTTPLTNTLWRLGRVYCLCWHRLQWRGAENVPAVGAVILAANHTTGIDPLLIQTPLPRMVRWVMLQNYQFRILNFAWRVIQPITVKQDGKDSTQLRRIITTLRQGEIVGIFPEGGAQRDHRILQPFEPGIGLIARKTNAILVPVWIQGTPRTRSMLWHFLLPSRSRIVFGKAYRPDPSMNNQQVTDDLRKRMIELSDTPLDAPPVVA